MLSFALLLAAAPPSFTGGPALPPPLLVGPGPVARATPGIGARLSAKLRESGLERDHRVLIGGISREEIRQAGGQVLGVVGPVVSAQLSGHEALALARAGALIDSPQPLRAHLDVSRPATRGDLLDLAEGLPMRLRGAGVLVATYDTGLDLFHPDFREIGGKSRAIAYWDQAATGTPPAGKTYGDLCDRARLERDGCPHVDTIGHGTSVMGVLASNGPQYRGLAPEAQLIVASSRDFEGLVDALDWFGAVALAEKKPLVVNLSLGGQEGPHDGTSLEAQALDAFPSLVVTAAGNEGAVPVHARVDAATAILVLRFPLVPQAIERRAVVDVWADGPTRARALLVAPDGSIVASSTSIGMADPGRTEPIGGVGEVVLDAEAIPNPFNMKTHLRIEWRLQDWEDPPVAAGYAAIELTGAPAHVWVDTPASEPAPVRFADLTLIPEGQVNGDTQYTISDLGTAAKAIAVSSYTCRTEFFDEGGTRRTASGSIGVLSDFSAYGPSLDPAATGEKPELAAPGSVIISARSRAEAEDGPRTVDSLYRAASGTSFAAPHVAGAAAAILSGAPTLAPGPLKAFLVAQANTDGSGRAADPRWGAGRLDADAAARAALGVEEGCGCTGSPAAGPRRANVGAKGWYLLAFLALGLGVRRRAPA